MNERFKSEHEMLADVVAAIVEAADEIKEKQNTDRLEYGQLLAYAEALSIIRDACNPDILGEIELDFDIDDKYT